MSIQLLIAAALLLQDKPETGVFDNLPLGKHVLVTLKNTNTFAGIVSQVTGPKDKPATHLTLDISYDFPGIDGWITFKSMNVKSVTILPDLTDEAARARLEEKIKAVEDRKKSEAERLDAEKEKEDRDKAAAEAAAKEEAMKTPVTPDAVKKESEDLTKGMELYKKYPPEQGWGEKKFFEITLKAQNDKSSLTPDEKEFFGTYMYWEIADAYMKKKAAEAGGTTTP